MVSVQSAGSPTSLGIDLHDACSRSKVGSMSLNTTAVRIRVTLKDVKPEVMRRLVVPVTLRLDRLHLTLQSAFGWTNSHLFEFHAGEERWGMGPNSSIPTSSTGRRSRPPSTHCPEFGSHDGTSCDKNRRQAPIERAAALRLRSKGEVDFTPCAKSAPLFQIDQEGAGQEAGCAQGGPPDVELFEIERGSTEGTPGGAGPFDRNSARRQLPGGLEAGAARQALDRQRSHHDHGLHAQAPAPIAPNIVERD